MDPLLAAARQAQLLERRRTEGRKIRRKLAVQFDIGVLQVLTAVQRREIHRFALILKMTEICARKTVEIGKIAIRDMYVIQLLQSGQIGQRSLDADDVQELQIGHVTQKIEVLPFVQRNLLGSLVIQPMRAGIIPDAVRVVFRLDLGIVCLSDPFFIAVKDFHPIADDKQLMYARKILRRDSGFRRNGRHGGRRGSRFGSGFLCAFVREYAPEHNADDGEQHDSRRGDDPFTQLRGDRNGLFQRSGDAVAQFFRCIALGIDRVPRHQCVLDQRRRRRTVQIDRDDVGFLRVETQEFVDLRRVLLHMPGQEEQNGAVLLRCVLRIDGESFSLQRVEDRSDGLFVLRRKQRVQRAFCHGIPSPFFISRNQDHFELLILVPR